MGGSPQRIFLSPPHMDGTERDLVNEAFDSGYIAPAGGMIDRFEQDFCDYTGFKHAVALSSGTAAIHLMLRYLEIGAGDTVWTPSLTFIGGVAPILYQGAEPVFFDVSPDTWTLDPDVLDEQLNQAAKNNTLPKAVLPTDIYGQGCDLDRITQICSAYDIPVIVDSAEAVGTMYQGRHAGKGALAAAYSFNGNKIMTTSGGGMLASDDKTLVDTGRKLSQQAREDTLHYEHETYGYNYRMSNICAAIGVGQLAVIEQRVKRKRQIFDYYVDHLAELPGISFMPEADYGRCSRWLSVMLVDPEKFGCTSLDIINALEADNIESRPVWKPMHMQPMFKDAKMIGGKTCETLYAQGLCLPSGTAMDSDDLDRIIDSIRKRFKG